MKTDKGRWAAMLHILTVAAWIGGLWVGGMALTGGSVARAAATIVPTQQELDDVTKKLQSNDDAQIKAAWEQVEVWLAEHHCPTQMSALWLPTLMSNQRYQEVIDFSLEAALAQPYARNMAKDLDLRANAYLALGKTEEALQAAKRCFDVCEIKETEREIKLLSTCLAKRFPDDKGIERRFKLEQSKGSATTQDSTSAAGGSETKPASVLDVVKVDASIFEPGLAVYRERTGDTGGKLNYGNLLDKMYYGNLLLASGNAVKAEKIFREMREQAVNAKDRTDAAEAIARALRAEDGNLGRANAWLASVPKEVEALP